MKRIDNLPGTISAWLLGSLLCIGSLPVMSTPVEDLGLFELDGNALQDDNAPPDDWETLYNGGLNNGGSPEVFTGINPDAAPVSIFDGGKKDIQDIGDWSHKDGSVPDKDDITNAYAASYIDSATGDRILYFGADRFSNVGDAFLGFWFFKDEVEALADGSFSGDHQLGDTLVLVNFPQANNAVPLIQVVEWVGNGEYAAAPNNEPGCSKAANNNPQPGQCIAKNLRLIAGDSGDGAICNNGGIDDACAITNEGNEDSPWPYTAKNGLVDAFPFESFFEGGINLTRLIPGDGCFASFMAETRSSSSFTATLKDFVLDSFPVCTTGLDTEIHDSEITDDFVDIQNNPTNTGKVHDAAYLEFSAQGTLVPEGTVTFTLYESTCSALEADYDADMDIDASSVGGPEAVVVTQNMDGTITNGEIIASGATDVNDLDSDSSREGQLRVESSDYDLLPGTGYAFWVTFDSSNSFPSAGPHCEQITVNSLNTSIATEIHAGNPPSGDPGHTATDIQDLAADIPDDLASAFPWANATKVGTIIHDRAYVDGVAGIPATGTVTFKLFQGEDCTGSPLAFDTGNADSQSTPDATKYVATLATGYDGPDSGTDTDDSVAESIAIDTKDWLPEGNPDIWVLSILTSFDPANDFYNVPDTHCENIVIEKYEPTIYTKVIIQDIAVVSGNGSLSVEADDASVTFKVFSSDNCTGPATTYSNMDLALAEAVLNTKQTVGDDASERGDSTTPVTTYVSYLATYNGNKYYASETHECEVVAVTMTKDIPTPPTP